MSDMGQIIRDRRKASGLTQSQLAAKIGLSDHTFISKVETGRGSLTGAQLSAAADVLGVSLDLLLGRESQPESWPASVTGTLSDGLIEIDRVEFAAIPRFDARLSAGSGSIVPENPEPQGYQLFEHQWLRAVTVSAPHHLALLRVDGESMEETLFDGDWVLIDRNQTNPAREGIYALRVNDVAWVKRLSINVPTQTVVIKSDNPKWDVKEWPASQVDILGRIVWLAGRRFV
jgi:phage repressor protein C with HTH and peptisase S24 domain